MRTLKPISFSLLGLLLVTLSARGLAAQETASDSAANRLHELFDAEWDWTMRNIPTWASELGDVQFNDRWPDLSLKAIRERNAHRRDVLQTLETFDVEQLSAADRINYRLFRRQYAMAVEEHGHRWHLLPLTMRGGIQHEYTLADSLPFRTVKDYEDWLARLRAFPVMMDQTLALMREGIEAGMVHPKVVMQRVPSQIRQHLVDDPADNPYYKPFRSIPDEIKAADRERLQTAAKRAIAEGVVPAFRKMLTFFENEYLPACPERVGVGQFPNGEEMYAFFARQYTTTDLTPKEIHELGLKEVARIRGEMEGVIRQVGFQGTFREFLDDLRTNPKFYYDDPNELLAAYQAVSKEIDPHLTRLFKRLPRIPYGVEPIPAAIAPDTTTAYYRPPSADGLRAGTYFVNLFKPEVRPKYEMVALSLHEAVPGHHLQISLAMELEGLPQFRRYTGYTAFVEGWALYAEKLGEEMDLYDDPYSKFGQLTYEMWRAIRLVVDTGMHTFGWSRQQAIDLFAENTAKTLLDIENEVDRYISWPGQALAYKIGELKIRELRRKAEQELGDAFDIREFHDVVLSSGAVTLDVLQANVDEWMAAKGAGSREIPSRRGE